MGSYQLCSHNDLPEGPSMLFPCFHSLTQLYEFIQTLAIEIKLIVMSWETVLAYQPLYVKSENSFWDILKYGIALDRSDSTDEVLY